MSITTDKLYLWVKQDRAPTFVLASNLIALYKDPAFNSNEDKIYEVGPEVKLDMTIKVVPAKPTTRSVGITI